MKKSIVYIGDFDFRNENVQSHLVKNNSKILKRLGYEIFYIGIDKMNTSCNSIKELRAIDNYLELPNTLNIEGFIKRKIICKKICNQLDELKEQGLITHVITYQSPTYSIALKKIAMWCKKNKVSYIVNCADIPIFDSQPMIKRIVMKWNWNKMHKYNMEYSDGIIAVSTFIKDFYRNNNCIIVPPLFDAGNGLFRSLSERNKTVSFVYAGTPFIKTKGCISSKGMKDRLDRIIDLFLYLSKLNFEYNFIVIGIGLENYISAVPRHKGKVENDRHITFLGKKSHDETLKLIADSDFSINYRDNNLMNNAGFSTKIVESVSLGTPVIINEISDISLYLRKGIDWFELNGSTDEDIELLSSLIQLSKESRTSLKKQCMLNKSFRIDSYESIMAKLIK